jgi:hypothetical protein
VSLLIEKVARNSRGVPFLGFIVLLSQTRAKHARVRVGIYTRISIRHSLTGIETRDRGDKSDKNFRIEKYYITSDSFNYNFTDRIVIDIYHCLS